MFIRKISFFLVLFCLIWFPFQDTILSLFYRFKPTVYWRLLLVFKELLIISALVLLFLRKFLFRKVTVGIEEIMGGFYVVFCISYLLLVRAEGVAQIAVFTTFRSAILPVLFVFTGKWLNLSEKEIKSLCKVVIIISIISVSFGIVEMLFPINRLWNGILDLNGYLKNIKGIGGFIKGVPGNFWGFVGVRRMAGTFASPLALGYYLIVPILLLMGKRFVKVKKGILTLIFLFCGLLLTETRAAIIGLIIGIILYNIDAIGRVLILFRIEKRLFQFLLLIFLIFVGVLIFSSGAREFIVSTITVQEGRGLGHLRALKRSIANAPEVLLVGKGWGTAGGWAALQGSKIVGAGETAYLSIMYQIGGVGLLLFLMWWSWCVSRIRRRFRYTEDIFWRNMGKIMMSLNIVYFLTGFISEQILTFTSAAHFWILTGAVLGAKREGK